MVSTNTEMAKEAIKGPMNERMMSMSNFFINVSFLNYCLVNTTKVMLSPKEPELVKDTRWILTKNTIIQKVYSLFGELSHGYRKAPGKRRISGMGRYRYFL